MKIIFLDIDGVLNCRYTKDKVSESSKINGIEDKKIELLKEIVNSCDEECRIVLTSSWKITWFKNNKNGQDINANYLDKKLKEHGLEIYDKTIDMSWNRGRGIRVYLKNCNYEVSDFIVLDDEIFNDYNKEKIMDHLIKTDIIYGLDEYHKDEAIKRLNKK